MRKEEEPRAKMIEITMQLQLSLEVSNAEGQEASMYQEVGSRI